MLADLQAQASKGAAFAGDTSARLLVVGGIFGLVWLVTGSQIVSRQPRNVSGWIAV